MRIFSSNIRTADYNRVSRELTIVFINRPMWTYIYYKVPPNIWVRFLQSASKGQFFADMIKDKYAFTKNY